MCGGGGGERGGERQYKEGSLLVKTVSANCHNVVSVH